MFVASLDSPVRTRLLTADATNVLYSQGHLLFLRRTTLMAQPFDARRAALTGNAFPVAEPIETQSTNPPFGLFSASENGVLVYQPGTPRLSELRWFDRTGKPTAVLGDRADFGGLELSPDGKRAAVSLPNPPATTRDIWLYDVARGLPTRFTFDPSDTPTVIWSPDGSHVALSSRRKGNANLYQKASNGAGAEEILLADGLNKAPSDWAPNGQFILYTAGTPPTGPDLWVLPLSGDRKPFPFLQTPAIEVQGRFAPAGQWVAYQSNESGRNEIYVRPFPGPGGKWQVSKTGGTFPRWRRDGKEVFYLALDNTLMAAAVNASGSGFEVGAVQPLFATRRRLLAQRLGYPYDVSADGQRFLVNTTVEQTTPMPITLVVNWTAGLNK